MPTRAPIHHPAHALTRQQNSQQYNQWRGSAAARGYDRDWQRVRDAHLLTHPLCLKCEQEDVVKAADLVDHIVPVRVDGDRRLDETNLQSLCHWHHALKTDADLKRWPELRRG